LALSIRPAPVTIYGPFFDTTIFLSEGIIAPGTLLFVCTLMNPGFGFILGWNYINPLPIKEIHDRWINGYASRAIDYLPK
jgi:hypothetical protein